MPASKAEKWATRALLAMGRAGVEVPSGVEQMGFAGIAVLGLKSLLSMNWTDAEPLMEEMFSCIRIQPDPGRGDIVRALVEEDIEEIQTRARLRAEVIDLHAGFSFAGKLFDLTPTAPPASKNTSTSHKPSRHSSPPTSA